MEIDRDQLELRDDPGVVSPPSLDPAWQCGTAVVVRGFIPDATLDIELDGAVVIAGLPAGFPEPNGRVAAFSQPLTAGQHIRARQTFSGATSDWSAPVTALDHTQEFPAGPPRPEINPAPVYECGTRTGVSNLLVGSKVWITADGVEVGRVSGAAAQQGVNVRPYGLNQSVVAFSSLCDDPSPPSAVNLSQPAPAPLPVPAILPVYEGGKQLVIVNVVNGGRLTLSRNGILLSTFSSWGQRHTFTLSKPVSAGDKFLATPELCPGAPPGLGGGTTALPCSALPAPGVEPIQAGDTCVTLTSFVPDGRIKVFVNGIKHGDGSGPLVTLTTAVGLGDTVDVLQNVGACAGRTVQRLSVLCVAPPVTYDPSALDLFPVGTMVYNAGTVTVTSGNSQAIAGTVYYPADADGVNTPFNTRLANLGRVPVVVLVHGRHRGSTTSHLGYDYLQQQLAQMGLIAVSVDCNASDSWGGWAGNIRDRADIVIASIAHMQSLDAGADPIFGQRIDFSRLALMGHSRGGEAVLVVPEIISLPGVTIRGVISLGPVNSNATSGQPKGHAFMAMVPACDGDVVDNDGVQFYDTADPATFKSQLYIHHANHNFFNRQWTNDDTNGGLPIMTRSDHERILSCYGCAFFRAALLRHNTVGFLDGTMRPPGVLSDNVHLSFKKRGQVTIDDHEDGNGINQNSFAAPTAQSGGLTANEHPFVHVAPGRFNDSFFGNTTGMVARSEGKLGTFRSGFDHERDLHRHQIWVRVAEVYDGSNVPPGATGFLLGLEDAAGAIAWVDADSVGGLPRPLDRRAYDLATGNADMTKTILKTLRFPADCFKLPPGGEQFDAQRVVAVHLNMNRTDRRALAFDDLQIVAV